MLTKILTFLKTEPVMAKELLTATLALAVSFGFRLTSEQIGATLALSTIILGILTRSQVSPTNQEPPRE